MLRRNFHESANASNRITLEDAFLLTKASCVETKERIRFFACRELGWEIWKNPRLAAPVAREIFRFRETSDIPQAALYGTLLTVMENGLGGLPDTALVKMADTVCFDDSKDNRSVAAWVILKNLEEAWAIQEPYTYSDKPTPAPRLI